MKKGLQHLADEKSLGEYRRRIDFESVLDHYGARNTSRLQGVDGTTEIRHSCLLDTVDPHHNHGDENPSARANLDYKLYHCYTYGGGDVFWFIMQMEQKETVREIIPILSKFLGEATESSADFLKELDGFFTKNEVKVDIPTYSERVLKPWMKFHPYLSEVRGISLDAASLLKVGYDERDRRIVFPHFMEGKLVGWQKRAITDDRWPLTQPDEHGVMPKYKSTAGFPKSEWLYNLDRVRTRGLREVIVVESPMSVLKAETLQLEAEDNDDPLIRLLRGTVATFGAKVSDRQIDLLSTFDKVYVYLDDDEPGQRGAKSVLERLYRRTSTVYIPAEEGKDLGYYSRRESVQKVFDQQVPGFLQLGTGFQGLG